MRPKFARLADQPRTVLALIASFFFVAPVFALSTWQAISPALLFYALPVVLFQLLIIILATSSGLSLIGEAKSSDRLVLSASLVWLISISVSAVLASYDPPQAMVRYYISLVCFLYAVVLTSAFGQIWVRQRENVLRALAWGCVSYSLIVIVMVLAVWDQPNFKWAMVGAGTTNFRQLGFYGLTLAGIGAGILVTSNSRDRQGSAAIFLFAGILMVFWSGGRAAFGGLIFVLLSSYLFGFQSLRNSFLFKAIALAAIAAPLSEILAPDPMMGIMRIISRSTEVSVGFSSSRLDLWLATIDAVSQNWLFGYGEGQFRTGIDESRGGLNHPHNFLLQFLYQWGVIGTSAIAVIACRLLWNAQTYILDERSIRLPAFATLLGLTAMATLEGSFFHAFPIMVSLTCLALLVSPGLSHRPDESHRPA